MQEVDKSWHADRPPWQIVRGDGPIITTAIHAGHDVRPELADYLAISEEQRRREEDPLTGFWTTVGDSSVLVFRSRFEVDMNRSRNAAIVRDPESAWGLNVWTDIPPAEILERSLSEYGACLGTKSIREVNLRPPAKVANEPRRINRLIRQPTFDRTRTQPGARKHPKRQSGKVPPVAIPLHGPGGVRDNLPDFHRLARHVVNRKRLPAMPSEFDRQAAGSRGVVHVQQTLAVQAAPNRIEPPPFDRFEQPPHIPGVTRPVERPKPQHGHGVSEFRRDRRREFFGL
jgi:hypothetical protein